MKRKKKNNGFNTFLVSTILIVSLILIYKYEFSDKVIDNNKKNIESKEETNKENDISNEDNNNTDEKNSSKNDEKKDEKKDDNVFEKIIDYKKENLNRYLTYKEKNKELSNNDIVTYVNIGLDYEFYSYIDDTDLSYDNLVLMNKYNKLPDMYEPSDLETISNEYFINGNQYVRMLRKDAKEAFEKLSQASIENGTPVYGQSAYRPYTMQEKLYNNAVNSYGKDYADSDTARPGHSEHQTGLAIDVSSTKGGNMLNFENTSSFEWMRDNAHKYGFILRYQKDKTNITGFIYESWHYRYVGVDVATDIHDNYSNLTYEEYYYRYIEK